MNESEVLQWMCQNQQDRVSLVRRAMLRHLVLSMKSGIFKVSAWCREGRPTLKSHTACETSEARHRPETVLWE